MLKKINGFLNLSIVMAILFAILGTVIIVYPTMSLNVLAYVVSILLIVSGVFLFILDLKISSSFLLVDNVLTSIMCILLGIVILMYPNILNVIIPTTIGIYFISSGIFRLRFSLYLRDSSYYFISIISSILSIVCGVILLINPMMSANVITIFVGVTLIVYALSDMIDIIAFKKNINSIAKYFKNFLNRIDFE